MASMASPTKALSPLADNAPGDAELVARAREGDSWAEGAIYRRYAQTLSNLAARMLGNPHEALDVLHDVFVEALDQLGDLRQPEALRGWLVQRTVRQVHRRFRRRSWWRWLGRHTSEELSLSVLASPGCPPDVKVELDTVAERLALLPARQRIAWVLHRIEGETLPSVAEACGTSVATVKRDLAAAQQTLFDEVRR